MLDKDTNKEQLKELARYGIASLANMAFAISVYHILLDFLDQGHSNLIAFLVAETYAFFTNKLYVFQSHSENRIAFLSELVRFFLARGVIEIFDHTGLLALVEIVHLDPTRSKYLIQIAVFLLNYLIRKKFVFAGDDV